MIHAMKEALKKHMSKAKMPQAEGSPAEEALESPSKEKKEQLLGDNAPEAAPHEGVGHSGEIGPEHIELLKKLISQISHPGRSAMTLDERAGDAMNEKMASIMAHKKHV